MKNQNPAINIEIEYCEKETISDLLELSIFTDITESILKSKPILAYHKLLDFISFENNLKAIFTPTGFKGNPNDIKKANEILIRSVIEN